jgi:aminoglycoside phosphotransferase family enzyme
MTSPILRQIIDNQAYPGAAGDAELIETHISWVVLTKEFAFKIKKPVRFPFLDFSMLDKRQFFCEREVVLNNRLSRGIYLGVLPIHRLGDQMAIGGRYGEVVDYAVQMKRLDSRRLMPVLLESNSVIPDDLRKIARQLAAFHASAETIRQPPDVAEMQADFADILKIKDFVRENISAAAAQNLERVVSTSQRFLQQRQQRLTERALAGNVVDGHGDLHSRNIFLLEEPVIFDCIEFNDHLRQGDVLNEIAFLEEYLEKNPCIRDDADWQLFRYFKSYRANVRAKVTALRAMQEEPGSNREADLVQVKKYLALLKA